MPTPSSSIAAPGEEQRACSTVRIAFGNERLPTGEAGIGGCIDVTRHGRYLYALQQRSLTILDLADPARPTPVGSLADLGNLRQVVVRGSTAFITAREDGLFLVDVSNPARPRTVARYDTIEFATGIDVRGPFAFIACRWFGVEIVDVSDAAVPRHVSVMRAGEAQSCEINNGILYAGAWEERRVAICDVRNPAAPRQIATVELGGRGDGVRVHNGVLYAATGHHQKGAALDIDDQRYGAGNGMDIVDVSDPARPRHLSRVQFDWRFYYGWPDTWRVQLSFPYAYLSHTYNGVFVLDVSNPREPRELAQLRIPLYPGEPGYRELKTTSAYGRRPPILPFDPTRKLYSPVCGLAAVDGCMYIGGLFSDLHVFHDEELVKPESVETTPETGGAGQATTGMRVVGDFHETSRPALRETLGAFATQVAHYRPAGQVYAAVEKDGQVYAACGLAGLHVLDQDLRVLATHATRGFAMDVQVAGTILYTAESSGGLGCYKIDGTTLALMHTYPCQRPVRQVRVSPDGRFAVIHAGGAAYEVLDVSGDAPPRLVRTERGWGGLVYYRQLCNGFVDGRYICGTWCAGRTFMLDLGGDEPVPMPDVPEILPDMEAGGYCPCGPYALLTRGGGYSFYAPGFKGNYEDLPVHRIEGGPAFYGKPTCRGNTLVACNRISGQVTLVDVSCLTQPRLICQHDLSGSPDCAFIGDHAILIPAGYQGLFKISGTPV